MVHCSERRRERQRRQGAGDEPATATLHFFFCNKKSTGWIFGFFAAGEVDGESLEVEGWINCPKVCKSL